MYAHKDEYIFRHSRRRTMRRYRLRRTGMLFLLFPVLFVFAACGSKPAPQQAAATPTPVITPTPAVTPTPTLPEVASTLVHFTTRDHVQLGGLFYGKGGTTAIICSHELRSTKADWSDSAPWFAARGFMVLAYDFRGYGDSQGPYDSSKEDQDLLAAAKTRVAGVITLSPEYLFGLSDNEIRAISAPKLFINSAGDSFASDTQLMFQNARPPKALHLYAGSAHGVTIFETSDGQDLIARIIVFANKYAPLQ